MVVWELGCCLGLSCVQQSGCAVSVHFGLAVWGREEMLRLFSKGLCVLFYSNALYIKGALPNAFRAQKTGWIMVGSMARSRCSLLFLSHDATVLAHANTHVSASVATSTLLAAALSPPFAPLHPRAQTEWCALPLQDELRKGLGRFYKNPHELFPWGFLGSRVWDEDIPFLHEARKVGWKLTLLF